MLLIIEQAVYHILYVCRFMIDDSFVHLLQETAGDCSLMLKEFCCVPLLAL